MFGMPALSSFLSPIVPVIRRQRGEADQSFWTSHRAVTVFSAAASSITAVRLVTRASEVVIAASTVSRPWPSAGQLHFKPTSLRQESLIVHPEKAIGPIDDFD
jgi:hypothetical protein